jgi:hypothetical protein
MVRPFMVMSVLGRIMQGSAPSLGESIFYEICGTLAELMTADQLLRGYTPVMATLEPFKKRGTKGNTVAVDPERIERRLSVRPNDGRTAEEKVDAERTHFCANAMIILTITESAAIVCTSVYWYFENINPSGVGITAGKLPSDVVLMNFLIQAVFEW